MSHSTLRDTLSGYKKIVRVLLRRVNALPDARSKRLLLLAWEFPPHVSGGVYRPASFVSSAIEQGWEVTVACKIPPDTISSPGQYLFDNLGAGVKYIHLQETRLVPSFSYFPRVDGGTITAVDTTEALLDHIEAIKPSIIVSSGPPFHNFLVAYFLRRKIGVPYVLDYRDEWSESPFPFVDKGKLNRFVESLCLKHASKVVFTTQRQKTHQLSVFPVLKQEKVRIIKNGWDPRDSTKEVSDTTDDRFISITFAGALSDHTLPKDFLDTLETVVDRNNSLINTLRIQFIGKKSPVALKQLSAFKYPAMLDLIEQIPKSAALQAMSNSNMLLLINSKSFDRYIPGKLYDYIASGTPILVFGKGGEIADIVDQLSVGSIIDSHDSVRLEDSIARYSQKDSVYPRSDLVETWLSQHTRQRLGNEFVRLIESV